MQDAQIFAVNPMHQLKGEQKYFFRRKRNEQPKCGNEVQFREITFEMFVEVSKRNNYWDNFTVQESARNVVITN